MLLWWRLPSMVVAALLDAACNAINFQRIRRMTWYAFAADDCWCMLQCMLGIHQLSVQTFPEGSSHIDSSVVWHQK